MRVGEINEKVLIGVKYDPTDGRNSRWLLID